MPVDAMSFNSSMLGRRPPISRQPEYAPGHPAYRAPQGPAMRTLPQRVGMSAPAGSVTPVQQYGSTADLYLRGGPGGGPLLGRGSGNVLYRDGQYTGAFASQENPAIARDRMYGAAAGSGPYDGSAGMRHFGPLAGPTQHVEQPVPIGTTYAGGSMVRGRTDGGTALVGRSSNSEADRIGALNAQGRHLAYRSSGQPTEAQRATIAKYDQRDQMMRANRNITANRRYGAPLRPDLFPGAQQAYAQQGPQQTGPSPAFQGILNNSVTTDAEGNQVRDWNGVARRSFDNPQYRKDPAAAWREMQSSGITSDQIAEMHDAAKGSAFGSSDPEYAAWLDQVRKAAGAAEQSDPGEYPLESMIFGPTLGPKVGKSPIGSEGTRAYLGGVYGGPLGAAGTAIGKSIPSTVMGGAQVMADNPEASAGLGAMLGPMAGLGPYGAIAGLVPWMARKGQQWWNGK